MNIIVLRFGRRGHLVENVETTWEKLYEELEDEGIYYEPGQRNFKTETGGEIIVLV